MLNKFFKYLENNFNKSVVLNQTHYSFKESPQSLIDYHNQLSLQKQVKWTPKDFCVISYSQPFSEEQIEDYKNRLKVVKEEKSKYLYKIEEIPVWFIEFSKIFTYLNLFRGSIVLSSDFISNATCIKPNSITGQYYIGQYSGITPESCPIFTNNDGEIFVYEAKEFRRYPQNEKQVDKYLKSKLKVIKSWKTIDEFLTEETERLQKIFEKNPTIYAIKNSAPNK